MTVSLGGVLLSYGPELPVGATIIEPAVVMYIGALRVRK